MRRDNPTKEVMEEKMEGKRRTGGKRIIGMIDDLMEKERYSTDTKNNGLESARLAAKD